MGNNSYGDCPVIYEKLNLILLIDSSDAMSENGITKVNKVVPNVIKKFAENAEQEGYTLSIRILSFNTEAEWIVGSVSAGVNIKDFIWKELKAHGETRTNKAIRFANEALQNISPYYYHSDDYHDLEFPSPIVILITSGCCELYAHADYVAAIDEMKQGLFTNPCSNHANVMVTRIAVGVGEYNRKELEEFASLVQIKGYGIHPLIYDIENLDSLCPRTELSMPEIIGQGVEKFPSRIIVSSNNRDHLSEPIAFPDFVEEDHL